MLKQEEIVRFGIDISRLATAHKTGTERYTWEVLAAIAQQDYTNEYTLYCRETPAELPELPANMQIRALPMRRLWTHIRLAAELWLHPPDVLFVPSHVVPWNAPLIRRMRVVTTVHDLGFLHFPAAHTWSQNLYLRLSTYWATRAAHTIIAISQATADDLVAYTGVDPARVVVIPHGVSPRFHPDTPIAQQETRYFLYVGTLQPRKNLMRLIHAFAQAQCHPQTRLLIAGRKGWLSEPLEHEIARLGLHGRVQLLGYVADEQLPGLLAGARAFVFPSLYEGFGMPVLEAMASGAPVLCSNTSALPEVAGDAALLVDPLDVDAMAVQLTRLDQDDQLYAELRQRGLAHARQFSWQACAYATIRALREAR